MNRSESGFTLIELLITIGILGVLATIAMVQYSEYRGRGFDSRAQTTMRIIVAAEEAYFIDHSVYRACDQTNCDSLLVGIAPIESGIQLTVGLSGLAFTGTATHVQGTGEIFSYP